MPIALDSPTFTRRRAVVAALAFAPFAGRAAAARSGPAVPALDAVPSPMLATVYAGQVDPAHCLVSEKYDGVRAIWDGRVLRHRSGRAVSVPPRFVATLPDVPLDGELWLGRGRFDALSGIVRKAVPQATEWAGVRYVVFDLPGAAGPFAERAARLAELVARAGRPQLVAAPQWRVDGDAALQRSLATTVAAGGEGLMLHAADSAWAPGRSDALLKLKSHLDAEAVVVGHRPGAGRYRGAVGALEVRNGEGRQFLVGSGLSDALRHDPPAPGESITYRYRDLTSTGLPRFATYLRRHQAL